jgi:hypothetical protein
MRQPIACQELRAPEVLSKKIASLFFLNSIGAGPFRFNIMRRPRIQTGVRPRKLA